MTKEDLQPEIRVNWRRTGEKPTPVWIKLCAKIFARRKEKPADSHPERGTNTAQDAGDGGQDLSQ